MAARLLNRVLLPFIPWVAIVAGCTVNASSYEAVPKINGVNLVAPPQVIEREALEGIDRIGADWVSIVPYGFSRAGQPTVRYNTPGQWWGERKDGVIGQIEIAQSLGKKVMLKPHVWVMGQGWPGDYTLTSEADWQEWEKTYELYILDFAHVAAEYSIDLFCIGTEYRKAVVARPDFWRRLILQVREIYKGPITYASNWDNYQQVPFWDALDYLGIDAYFPLVESKKNGTPEDLRRGWDQHKREILAFQSKLDIPVLFTEYGYRSIDYTAWEHYKIPDHEIVVNEAAQQMAYEAFFSVWWSEPQFAGGFLWKWFPESNNTPPNSRRHATGFTPQGKLAEETILTYYRGQ